MTPSQKHVQHILWQLEQQESAFLERSIKRAENKTTEIAKNDKNNKHQIAIEAQYKFIHTPVSLGQRSTNVSYNISSSLRRVTNHSLQQNMYDLNPSGRSPMDIT
jgi:hypothetical protein